MSNCKTRREDSAQDAVGEYSQLNLPISIFFLIARCPWYMNESTIPDTVKTPVNTKKGNQIIWIFMKKVCSF